MSETKVENQNGTKKHVQIVEVIRQTAPSAIAELDFVKKKFIDNYNLTHKQQIGELIYHRQLVHFKQIISASDKLKTADPFSLYACFLTAAVNGDSLDPQDEETYLIPLAGKAVLWPQVKSRVKRLRNSGQVRFVDQAKLVYQGDEFEVENGRVKRHVEKFSSETIIAGYVRFVLDDKGTDKYFIYRKSDWEAWRKKSPQANEANWNTDGQPLAAFLRSKIIKHACTDKSWSSSRVNPAADQFKVEIDDPDEVTTVPGTATDVTTQDQGYAPPAIIEAAATVVMNDDTEEAY